MTKRYTSEDSYTPRYRVLSGLQRTLLLYVVLPLLVLTGIAISFGLDEAAEVEDARLRGDIELVGRAIRLPISDALIRGNLTTVRANLDSVFSIGRVYGASVYDVNGVMIASAGIVESDLSQSLLAEQVVTTGEQQDSYREVAGRDVFSQFLPIQDRGGQIIGLLQITRKAQDFERSFSQLRQIAWITWLVLAVATVAILVFGHYRAVGQHVDKLVASMRRVAQGERDHRASTDGPEELREVAQGLNRMLDSIATAEAEIQRSQAQEAKLNQQLQASEKMAAIGQVASGVAHELGAPLTVIDGRARRLQQAHADTESQRQLNAIRGQVQRLTSMVKQLLAFSRTPVTTAQKLSVPQWLEQAYTSIGFEMDPQQAQLVPAQVEADVWVYGDPQRLELALVNVLRNAVQAAHHKVEVTVVADEQTIRIEVLDDGEGLPEGLTTEAAVRPFQTNKAQGQGTGLGLAIVEHILSDHSGTLALANAESGGCRVTLKLPRWLPQANEGDSA